jgi:outer membrane protein assembly factor BamB
MTNDEGMKPSPKNRRTHLRASAGVLSVLLLSSFVIRHSSFLHAADDAPKSPEDLAAKSLPLRTVLFHDPTLAPPFDRLLQLHREAGRAKELVDLYRQHVAKYPADTGALTVFVRLLAATDDPESGATAARAATRNPDNAFLQFLHFEALQKSHETGALDALDRAIAKETLPARKRAWIEQMLPLATADGRPELARQHLEALAAQSATAEEKVGVARKMIAQKLEAAALTTLEAAAALAPAAETGVEIDLAAASAELGLGKPEAAAVRLDRLLGRLAADYWRRPEILHRRTALVKTDAEREAMLGTARARWKAAPGDESATLEVAQLLAAFEFRREALDVLLDAAVRIPGSEKIEKTVLDLFDRLRDEHGREAFLAARQQAAPGREDLALARVRSLFLLNRRGEALTLFDAAAGKFTPEVRLAQTLELARFLRRNAQHTDAAEIFQRATVLAPARLDVRRELAETWLATGEKEKARAVFSAPLPDDIETENLLDVIQFLMKQDLTAEAQAALSAKVAREPDNFDLRMMQLTMAARLGDQAGGVKLIEEIRPLTDTGGRDRRWLEGAVAFHEAFETEGEFLSGQQKRIAGDPGSWTGAKLERTFGFIEVAATHGGKAEAAAMIEGALARQPAPELRTELRRRQLALIENDPGKAAGLEAQLKALIAEDPAHADEYRIRLALYFSKEKRTDQAALILNGGNPREPLAAIDLKKVGDAALLGGLETVLQQFGYSDSNVQLAILERLTTLEPGNRSAWERWLSALATSGDEDRLRASLRRLVAGVGKIEIGEETRRLLGEHLLASHWRSVHRLLHDAEENEARLAEVLPLLDAVDRLAKNRDEWLWIAWTRAYTLNRLGRREARDAAIREFDRVAALAEAPKPRPATGTGDPAQDETPTVDGIAFPDGLVIGTREAHALLTTPPAKTAGAKPGATGPRGPLRVRWAFDTERAASITKILPIETGRVLVLDSAGQLYCLDAASGKLLWSREGARPLQPVQDENGSYGGMRIPSPATPAADGARICLPAANGIECWSAEDGHLLWRAPSLRSGSARNAVHPSLFLHAGRLLVCDVTAASLAALDPATGKVIWQHEYATRAGTTPLHALNTGASLSNGRLLFYGAGAFVVNADDGALLWSFDASRVRAFPISLSEPAATPPPPNTPAGYAGRYGRPVYSRFSGGYGGYNQSRFFSIDYLQPAQFRSSYFTQPGTQFALTNSAAAWAAVNPYSGQTRFGVLEGDRMVLLNGSMLHTVRLDVPFSGGVQNANGIFIGVAGRRACLLTESGLAFCDSESVGISNIAISEPAEPDAPWASVPATTFPVQAAIDGLLVHVSGPDGIATYHSRTGERLQKTPWPANVVPPPQPVTAGRQSNYFAQGRYTYDQNGNMAGMETITARVRDGVLYTPVSSSRLVALTGIGKERAK